MKELRVAQSTATLVLCDNNSPIKLPRNRVFNSRSKYIDVMQFFLRDICKQGEIQIDLCMSEEQVADILTKHLKFFVFKHVRDRVGLCEENIS